MHINSGFVNKWFYILTAGEQHTNEFGTPYSVQGIGMPKSTQLIYHTLTSYLVPNSGFQDFYYFTLQSAVDLYGSCSPEYQSVRAAWKAVGFGNDSALPELNVTGNLCHGDSVLLHTEHVPGSIYTWLLNGILIDTGLESQKYISAPGDWVVSVMRCGQLNTSGAVAVQFQTPVIVTTQNITSCEGIPAVLQGFPLGGIFDVPNPYSGTSTSFTYTYTDSSGCSTAASGFISMHPLPDVCILTSALVLPVNNGEVSLEANVPGTFSGPGVSGNKFFPETAGVGGPYTVILEFSSSEGCISKDSIMINVIPPCIKSINNVEITTPLESFAPKQVMTFEIDAFISDFSFKWKFPPGCTLIGPVNEKTVTVLWSESNGRITVNLTNTCNERFEKSFDVILHEPEEEFQVIVFPNPSGEFINIIIPGIEINYPITIELRDLGGKLILFDKIISGLNSIPLKNISPGSYIVTVANGNKVKRQQLIVK